MANLPSNSFVSVNDIETAQGAPVSEALAQKSGTNENTNDARITSNDSDISTNASAIALKDTAEVFRSLAVVVTTSSVIHTFASAPKVVIMHEMDPTDTVAIQSWVVIPSFSSTVLMSDASSRPFSISGSSIVYGAGGNPTTASFKGVGIL